MAKLGLDEYLVLSEKTLSMREELHLTPEQQKLLHGAIGLSTEANEVLDQMKKHIYYGKELDKRNLREEIGDIFRYIAIFARELDMDIEEVLFDNIEKLRKRYGEKFTKDGAINRDIENELSHISKE